MTSSLQGRTLQRLVTGNAECAVLAVRCFEMKFGTASFSHARPVDCPGICDRTPRWASRTTWAAEARYFFNKSLSPANGLCVADGLSLRCLELLSEYAASVRRECSLS